MLISLLRVINIGMPIFFNMTLYWMPFVYVHDHPLGVHTVEIGHHDRRARGGEN